MIRDTEPDLSVAELDNLVASRMARQTLLTRATAPQFLAVVHEVALRIPVGAPGVMKRQLRYLVAIAERPNIDLQVVPISVGAHAGLRGPFVLLDFAEEPSLAFVENHDTGIFLEEDADVAGYRQALRNIRRVALEPGAASDLILSVSSELD
jgi:hypothetical protein